MYEFYMDGVRLPVTPSSLTIKISNQNKTINLINEGQRNIIKTPGLSKYSFNALLPNREYPFACYPNGYQPAQYYMSLLEKLKRECKPFEFLVIRTDDAGNLLMTNGYGNGADELHKKCIVFRLLKYKFQCYILG